MIIPWRIEMLGGLRARQGDQNMERFRRGKEAGLLAYLAYYGKRNHVRKQLVEQFWPGAETAAGDASLRVALAALRRRLEPPGVPRGIVIAADRTVVRLNPQAFVTDTAEFESAIQAARSHAVNKIVHLQEATDRYAGDLLPGYDEDWVGPERERLSLLYVGALVALATAVAEMGDITQALNYAHQAAATDPLSEEACLILMRLYAQGGRASLALSHYERLRRSLRRSLDAAPSIQVRQMAKQLRSRPETFVVASPATIHDSASTPSASRQGAETLPVLPVPTLPVPMTRFFGREKEIERLVEMLHLREARLITLTGPGGSGKTRLALECAHKVREDSLLNEKATRPTCRVWYVPLEDVAEPVSMLEKILKVLGGTASAAVDPLDQIVKTLAGYFSLSLLVLDNFEQLVEPAASTLQRLVEQAEGLSCLVTSRRELSLPGEQVVAVAPLPIPAAVDVPERLLENPAVRLFVDRSQARAPEFHLTHGNAKAVSDLVRRLEGIPLALELAAAWIRVHPPARILAQLQDRFGFLTKNQRGVSARHQTLWNAVAWSYLLLPDDVQAFLRSLSVFRGGWSLEAATEVTQEPSAADYLALLQEHSWVTAAAGNGEKRFSILETLREFAAERLIAQGLESESRTSHLRYFLDVAEQAEPEMSGSGQALWLAKLGMEQDNFRTAIDWAAANDVKAGLRLAAALWPFWEMRGHWREGQEWVEVLLHRRGEVCNHQKDVNKEKGASDDRAEEKDGGKENDGAQDEVACARVLTNLGALACRRSQYAVATSYMSEALALWRQQADAVHIGASLGNLGVAALEQYDYLAAATYLEEARTIQGASGDQSGLSRTLNNLAILAWRRENFVEARACYEAALPIKRAQEDLNGLASTLNNLGALLKDQGNLTEARLYFEECRLLFERLGSQWQLAYVLCNLGDIAAKEGDSVGAHFLFMESLTLLLKHNDRRAAVSCVEGLANLAALQGRAEEGAWLFGCSARLREELDMPATPGEQRDQAQARGRIGHDLGTSIFSATYEAGYNMSLEEAIARVRNPSGFSSLV